MTIPLRGSRSAKVALAVLCVAAFGVSGCSSTSSAANSTNDTALPADSTGTDGTGAAAAATGVPDLDTICPKLPVADAQRLIRTTLSTAVSDSRLGGCTFVLAGNAINDNNLTVALETGAGAADRYDGDVKGTFTAGGATVNTGDGVTTPLNGVGDKAVWGTTVGYPTVSALKGDVYCTVSTADDATQLTLIGAPGNPLPQGTPAEQKQYAGLEGALCNDLFALVQ